MAENGAHVKKFRIKRRFVPASHLGTAAGYQPPDKIVEADHYCLDGPSVFVHFYVDEKDEQQNSTISTTVHSIASDLVDSISAVKTRS